MKTSQRFRDESWKTGEGYEDVGGSVNRGLWKRLKNGFVLSPGDTAVMIDSESEQVFPTALIF